MMLYIVFGFLIMEDAVYIYEVLFSDYTYTSGRRDLDDDTPYQIEYFSNKKAAENYILNILDEIIIDSLTYSSIETIKAVISRNCYKVKVFYKQPIRHYMLPPQPKRAECFEYIIRRLRVREE